jgi:hypothetical protein
VNFVQQSLLARVAVLTALMVGLGSCAAAICGALSGWPGVEAALIAAVLCWLPGLTVFCLEANYRSPTGQVGVVLGGTLLRVAVAAGGVLMAMQLRPEIPRPQILGCLLVLYLASLAWETVALSKPATVRAQQPPAV